MDSRYRQDVGTFVLLAVFCALVVGGMNLAALRAYKPTVRVHPNTEHRVFTGALSHVPAPRVPEYRMRPALPATTTTTTPPCDYHCDVDWPIWSRIGRCEQPGGGPDGIAWRGGGPGYPGGLGIAKSTWDWFAPVAGVHVALGSWATPEQQMQVARADYRHFGNYSGWTSVPGCTGRLPALP